MFIHGHIKVRAAARSPSLHANICNSFKMYYLFMPLFFWPEHFVGRDQ